MFGPDVDDAGFDAVPEVGGAVAEVVDGIGGCDFTGGRVSADCGEVEGEGVAVEVRGGGVSVRFCSERLHE